MKLVRIYTGLSIEARMLQETLAGRGIAAIVRAAEPNRGVIGDAALPMFEEVLVSDADLAGRPNVIEECLDFVREGQAELEPLEEAGEDEDAR
jgi:hypothetical protein